MYLNLDLLENVNRYMFQLFCYKHEDGYINLYSFLTKRSANILKNGIVYLNQELSIDNDYFYYDPDFYGTIITKETFSYIKSYKREYCVFEVCKYNLNFYLNKKELNYLKKVK